MSFIKEFKEFAVKGNVVDMAVGIIIGASFGKIVSSFVNDIIMPPIGMMLNNIDFSKMALTIQNAAAKKPAVTINYGQFITAVIDFLIVAFAIFIVIRQMNKLKAQPETSNTKECPQCCTAIPINAKRCPHCTSEL
jgi:large conductance mechanosensitive channel